MNSNNRHAQFELFPGTEHHPAKHDKPKRFFSNVTLAPENIIVVSIVVIMMLVFSFSLGVERGRTLYAQLVPKDSTSQPVVADTTIADQPNPAPGAESRDAGEVVLARVEEPAIKSFTGSVEHSTIDPPVAPVVSQPLIPEDVYTVQVASFKTQRYAQQEATNLEKKLGEQIFVVSKGNYMIVCVGQFFQKNHATQLLHRLRKQYKDCLVRRL